MTWAKSLSTLFISAIILILAIWLLISECGKGKPALSEKIDASGKLLQEQKRLRDSAYNAQEEKDREHKEDSARWKKAIDSASAALSVTKKKLNQSQATADELADEVKDSYANKDTARFITMCRQLSDSVKTLNARVDQFEYQVDTLTRAKDSLQAVTQKRLEDREQLLSDWRKSIDETDIIISGLQGDLKKAIKKADKKYSVTIGGGPSISYEGRPGGSAGIFIGRTIFRF